MLCFSAAEGKEARRSHAHQTLECTGPCSSASGLDHSRAGGHRHSAASGLKRALEKVPRSLAAAVLLETHGPHSQPIDTPREGCLRDQHLSEGGSGVLGPRFTHKTSQQLRLGEELEHVYLIWGDFLYVL